MRPRRLYPVLGAATAVLIAAACGTSSSDTQNYAGGPGGGPLGAGGGVGGAAGTPPGLCAACLGDDDCGASKCAQFDCDTFCAPSCTAGSCPSGTSCKTLTSAQGQQVQVCVPPVNTCAGGNDCEPSGGGTAGTAGMVGAGGAPGVCGPYDAPTTTSCCQGCMGQPAGCQANGCFNGWYCNRDVCSCHAPPDPSSCGQAGGDQGAGGAISGKVTATGGTLSDLGFGIVGDTRPAVVPPPGADPTEGYPTAVTDKIWARVQAEAPPFVITTGDYMYAKPAADGVGAAGPQLDVYLKSRATYTGVVFPAMGNHECTGFTDSNCGPGSAKGVTSNYNQFLTKMLRTPLGITLPYYSLRFDASDASWSAKFVVIAANAWSATQATWLDGELAKPTTYTFVVRHEGSSAIEAPGVTPSAQIMAKYPYTLLLAGHTHTFAYYSGTREVIIGNGGAPLSGSVDYGYVLARRRADGAVSFLAKNYATGAVMRSFAVSAAGAPAP